MCVYVCVTFIYYIYIFSPLLPMSVTLFLLNLDPPTSVSLNDNYTPCLRLPKMVSFQYPYLRIYLSDVFTPTKVLSVLALPHSTSQGADGCVTLCKYPPAGERCRITLQLAPSLPV